MFFKKIARIFIHQYSKNSRFRWTFLSLVIFIGLAILSFIFYSVSFSEKIYPHTFIGQLSFAGLKQSQAKEVLKQQSEKMPEQVLALNFQDKNWQINFKDLKLSYDLDKTINSLFLVGRRPSFWQSIKEQFLVLFKRTKISASYSLDENKLNEILTAISKEIDIEAKDATVAFEKDALVVIPEAEGRSYDQAKVKQEIASILGQFLTQDKIFLSINVVKPKLTKGEIETALPQIQNLALKEVLLKSQVKDFKITTADIVKWIKLSPSKVLAAESQNPTLSQPLSLVSVDLDQEKIKNFVKKIAADIFKEPVNAKLTISDGKVTIFQASENGFELDQEKTVALLSEKISKGGKKEEITLPVKTLKPKVSLETINDLGIKELIGEGSSSFKGSPKNRIHNITVGANLFNGVLIAPGDVFSFNKVLGEVSASRGFLPELVIKEDRLIPETGGGLCQVSTTMFRAALYSGLDILERTAHAFRVRYYEPPIGFDATVYDPKPDLTFKNDTPAYILIQTRLEGTKLTFQFYGTKDGRKVETSSPSVYDYRSPGEPVYIDDSSLPAGEVVQIEKAVPGATASFNWKVTRDGQVLHQKTFVSKYVPWRAKYKRGIGPAPEPPPAEQPAPAPEQPAPTPEQPPSQ